MNVEQAIKELQDTLIVISEIEKRQSKLLREQGERLVGLEEQIAEDRRESAKFQKRIDQNLAEITDKLNGLIGYVDNLKPPHPPPG